MISRNPTLIFGDKHDDPVKLSVITKLIPRLRALGYVSFYDEAPSGFIMYEKGSYEDVLKKLNSDIDPIINELNQFLHIVKDTNKNLDQLVCASYINTPNDLLLLTYSITKIFHSKPLDASALGEKNYIELYNLLSIVDPYLKKAALLATILIFLQTLQKNNICYKGIDDKIMAPTMELELDEETITYDSNIEFINNTMKIRDKTMSEAYLSAIQPVFGRIGLDHFEGIQNEILGKIPKDEAVKKIIFLYIYTSQSDFDHLAARKLPLDIIAIDARTKTEDEIADFIISQIIERQKKQRDEPITKISTQALQAHSVFVKESVKIDDATKASDSALRKGLSFTNK